MLLKRATLSIAIILLSITGLFSSCSVTLNGASIPPEMKTINVEYFENSAPLVVNNLSQLFTEAIKGRVRSQTRLAIVSGDADASLSGTITGYSIAPVSVQATQGNQVPIASASRLTITVNVKYVNQKDPKQNYEQSFSRYTDFRGAISAQEQQLIQIINQQLTEDIFNRAFANW
jgi:hypothetical protein